MEQYLQSIELWQWVACYVVIGMVVAFLFRLLSDDHDADDQAVVFGTFWIVMAVFLMAFSPLILLHFASYLGKKGREATTIEDD